MPPVLLAAQITASYVIISVLLFCAVAADKQLSSRPARPATLKAVKQRDAIVSKALEQLKLRKDRVQSVLYLERANDLFEAWNGQLLILWPRRHQLSTPLVVGWRVGGALSQMRGKDYRSAGAKRKPQNFVIKCDHLAGGVTV
eukprot:scaffold82665_cov33-Prasinocladus_malaysianus.AAC.3